MNAVCYSVAEVLERRKNEIRFRTENNWAIYGTADFTQLLITQEGIGVRPILSGNLIDENGPHKISTLKSPDVEGYYYSINREFLTEDALNVATKDDLYLFVAMGHPSILRDENLKDLVLKRLSKIYEEELNNAGENAAKVKKQQEADKKSFMYIYDSVEKAVKGYGCEIYYAEGSQLGEQNQPE